MSELNGLLKGLTPNNIRSVAKGNPNNQCWDCIVLDCGVKHLLVGQECRWRRIQAVSPGKLALKGFWDYLRGHKWRCS